VTCGAVAIIIRVVLLSPYWRIRGVSLSSIRYNQLHRVYTEGAKKVYTHFKEGKNCIKFVTLNIYRPQKMHTSHV